MTGFTAKQRQMIRERDGNACVACGTTYGLTEHHRANRGAGGSKKANVLSNALTMCHVHNGLLESDPEFAAKGRVYGWKCLRHVLAQPADIPVWYVMEQAWYLLEDDGSRLRVPEWWQEELTRAAQDQLKTTA